VLNNLILWFPLIWILFILKNKWKNKCLKIYLNDVDKHICKKIRKRTRYNKNGKNSKIALFPKVFICMLFLAIKSKSNYKNITDIRNLSNHEFFTYESISATNKMNMIASQQNALLLKIFYLKITRNENRAFLLFLLILAGDIETNPGEMFLNNDMPPNNKFQIFRKRGMHFTHININSILPKIDELRLIASEIKCVLISISETKLDETIQDEEIKIQGYNLIRNDRNRNGGGVACYVREDIHFNIREELSDEIESIFFDILLPKSKPILVGVLYRPANQFNFLNKFSDKLNSIMDNFQELYILGDINIDKKSPLAKQYNEICCFHGLKQLIKSPTRITVNTSTTLDHILTNSKEKVSESGVIDISLSDHQMIFFTRKSTKQKFYKHKNINVRSMKNYSEIEFLNILKEIDFPNYNDFDDINTAYSDFINKVETAINKIAPFKKICIKNNTSEWVDLEILSGIKKRDKLFMKFKKTKSYNDHLNYKKARNNVQRIIKNKKRNFIEQKLTDNIGKPKELWKILRGIGAPTKTKSSTNICLQSENNISFDTKTNCEIFKNFFGNLAIELLNKLPNSTNNFGTDSINEYYNHLNIRNKDFCFNITSESVVLNLLQNIEPSKSAGIDNINGKFLKDGAILLANPVTKIFNLSIKLSEFPELCKIAKLKPLYKKGNKLKPENYRPISLLPLISKIFETIIQNQTQLYLDNNKILYKFQSGFRKHYSTDNNLAYLNDKILNGFEKSLYTGMVLIDLQKAFDTIDHNIFLKKLKCLGFAESSIKWFKSYLECRYFSVNIDNVYSEKQILSCGVPQGSILGPLIFLIYINDMAQAVDCDLYLFADDSCLVYSGDNVKEIDETLGKNFNSLCDWLVENKLSIHLGEEKTKSILFGSKRKLKSEDNLKIRRGNIDIKQHSRVTYLGCILDCNMSGEYMATKVLQKINARLRFLNRNRKVLNQGLRRILCNALIQPHFDYACQAWLPNLTKALSKKIQCAQNKCIRFCLKLNSHTHLDKHHLKEINWLPVQERMNLRICVNVYKFFNQIAPTYMSDIFIPHKTSINTRNSMYRLKTQIKKSNMGQKSLSCLGPKLWNILTNEIKSSNSTNSFKHKMKNDFFSNQ